MAKKKKRERCQWFREKLDVGLVVLTCLFVNSLNVNNDTKTIVLNTRDIKIHSAILSSQGLKTESK